MLSSYRVLDLTDDRGHMTGFLLAQLGAEVIAVEPAGGQRARRIGPFAGGTPHPERSLLQWSYDRGKRSVVVEGPEAAAQLERLAADADVLIECGAPPADLVDLAELRRRNPGLVTVSLSNFGATGPKAGWLATDLTLAAAAGQVALTGDLDRPPVRVSVPQVWANTASETACAVLVALTERERSGLGQHVDVSAQEAMMLSVQGWMQPALAGAPSVERRAGGAELLGFDFRFVYPCADGHVTTSYLPGVLVGPFTNRMLAWVHEQGGLDDELAAVDWRTLISDYDWDEANSIIQRTAVQMSACFTKWSKADLFRISRERHFLIMSIATVADVAANEQFAARRFWDEVGVDAPGGEHAGRVVRFPGPWFHTDVAPVHRLGRAPHLGQHSADLLGSPRPRPVGPAASGVELSEAAGKGALDGLTIVDLTWVYAGPFATRLLAYYGATVIRVESSVHPDQVRSPSIPRAGDGGAEDSVQWHSINADKLGLQLNLAVPEGRQAVLDLAAKADVMVWAFAPGVMDRFGLATEVLHAANPRLLTMSSCLFGYQGPLAGVPGFGMMGAASGGFYELTGWPDRLPAGPYLAYTDATSPRLTAALILAALLWRRRSGQGAHFDFSQAEGGVHFLTPALADLAVNGHSQTRRGNQDSDMAPHGVYPAGRPGADRWVAVACEDDRQWCTLATLLGRTDLAGLDAAARLERRDELDELVAGWTAGQDPVALQERLQAAGVPAHQVQNSPECVADPQLRHREHFVEISHPVYGHSWAEQYGFRLSRTPGVPRRAGPTWGQHNEEVLMGLLGYDADRLAELAIAGALE
jgi:crotonobetainyl-CoA:carnitine CoA-transferase CaiB-like acyl-CoA transferase